MFLRTSAVWHRRATSENVDMIFYFSAFLKSQWYIYVLWKNNFRKQLRLRIIKIAVILKFAHKIWLWNFTFTLHFHLESSMKISPYLSLSGVPYRSIPVARIVTSGDFNSLELHYVCKYLLMTRCKIPRKYPAPGFRLTKFNFLFHTFPFFLQYSRATFKLYISVVFLKYVPV